MGSTPAPNSDNEWNSRSQDPEGQSSSAMPLGRQSTAIQGWIHDVLSKSLVSLCMPCSFDRHRRAFASFWYCVSRVASNHA